MSNFDLVLKLLLQAIVLASIKGSASIAAFTLGGGFGYVLLMIFVRRPAFTFFARRTRQEKGMTMQTLTLVLVVLMVCA